MNRKQTNAVLLGLGWMVSLGAVFILGILSAFAIHLGPGATEGTKGDLTLDQREMLLTIERYTGEPGNIAEILSVGTSEGLTDQVEQTLRGIMRETDTGRRLRATSQMVSGLPSRRIMAGIKFLQEIPADPGRNQVLGIFLETWANEDGRRAMVFATSMKSLSERGLAIRAVLSGWSQVRPVEAWDWVLQNAGSSAQGQRWMEIVFSRMSAADRATAFNFMEQTLDPVFQSQMGGVVMAQILEQSTPREAIAWLSEFPRGAVESATLQLAVTWAVTEPWAAADWAWRGSSGLNRSILMEAIAEEWVASEGPAPLAEWLNNNGPDARLDGAIHHLVSATAEVDPATALGWAHYVQDQDDRSMLEIMIGRIWIRTDPEGAGRYLPDLLVSESARAALLEPEYYPEEEELVPIDDLDVIGELEPAQ
jgi:hypothetical protein